MRAFARLGTVLVCVLGCLLPAAALARRPRLVEFRVAVSGQQTTSWSASGSYAWCPDAGLSVPYDGSGRAVVHVSATGVLPLAPGLAPALSTQLQTAVDRTGSLVEHDGGVVSRPLECPPLASADTAADASRCGHSAGRLQAVLSARGQPAPRLSSEPGPSSVSGCPWITSLEDYAEIGSALSAHQETADGLIPVAFPGLRTPTLAPSSPAKAAGHASSSWQVTLPGGALSVETVTDLQVAVALAPMISPGRGIAEIRLGETFSELRRKANRIAGMSLPDGALLSSDRRHWIWPLEVPVPELDVHGDPIVERAWVSARAGTHHGVQRRGPPPNGARVAQVSTTGTYETTATGAGAGMTVSALRRAEPHGHTIVFGRPIAWVVDGPGRRRTAFSLFRGIVQAVEVGCRQTDRSQRGAPVSDSQIC